MQIDFKNEDQEPEAHRFVIHRDSMGSYELVDNMQPSEQPAERVRMVKRNMYCVFESLQLRIFNLSYACISCGFVVVLLLLLRSGADIQFECH